MSSFSFNHFSGMLGRRTIISLFYVIDLLAFISSVLHSWHQSRGTISRATRQSVISQVIFSGIDALPAISFLSLAIGLSVTMQFIFLLQSFATQQEITAILTQVIALELGPLLTAIIMIGRSGSAITVDLGNMTLNQEVAGLELLGIDVKRFFVLPRLLGVALSQLALAIYFSTLALVIGIIFAALLDSSSNFEYLFRLVDAFEPLPLLVFIIKNLIFGLIIAATACYHGLRVGVSMTELPQETQRAIVNSLLLVFLLDGLAALIWI